MYRSSEEKALFIKAVNDYDLLLEKGYPEKQINKLIGDRYRLSKTLRTVLFRGILKKNVSTAVAARLVPYAALPQSSNLFIDGYNVLLTCLHYRTGRPLFISTDGLLRDAGSAYGRIGREDLFFEVSEQFFAFFADLSGSSSLRIEIYFDAPVTNSIMHTGRMNNLLQRFPFNASCHRVPSADQALRNAGGGYTATSDREIIISSENKIIDLPRLFLDTVYTPEFPDLRTFPSLKKTQAGIDCSARGGTTMIKYITSPSVIEAQGTKPKLIEEFFGKVNSNAGTVSIAKMKSPSGWVEPGQTPEFDEYTLVLRGVLDVETKEERYTVRAGEAILISKGEWVRYSSPDAAGAEYVSVCLPAFSPDTVHRDE